MYYQCPFYDMHAYRPELAAQMQAPTSSISYTPVASSTRLLFKDNTWEIQFVNTTYEVTRQTVTGGASSTSVEYIDKYMIIKYKNNKVFETIYLN